MSRTLHLAALVTIICLLVMRIVPYYEGLEFDKYWSVPMGVLPVGLIAFLVFGVSTITCVASIFLKKNGISNIYAIVLTPVLILGIYHAPFPSYVDGMAETLVENLTLDEISKFADEARVANPKLTDYEEQDRLIEGLREKYPKALGLSFIEPRISVSEDHVSVFYGSALVKHWGYLITSKDKFPIEHIPEGMYKKVYEGVWVYRDIW